VQLYHRREAADWLPKVVYAIASAEQRKRLNLIARFDR
jgi:hypothetical protein